MRITLSILAICLTASLAMAQQALQPVDQAVGDLDPHSASLRVVQPGLASQGATRIYSRPGAGGLGPALSTIDGATGLRMQQQYRYSAPGVRAWMQRPDYLVRSGAQGIGVNVTPSRDGDFLERIPAGTVFDLVPRPGATPAELLSQALRAGDPHAMPEQSAADEPWTDLRMGGRLDTRVDGRIHARHGEVVGPTVEVDQADRRVPRVPRVLQLRRIPVEPVPERAGERGIRSRQGDKE